MHLLEAHFSNSLKWHNLWQLILLFDTQLQCNPVQVSLVFHKDAFEYARAITHHLLHARKVMLI